jgi:rod shape-determining protein MreC
VQGRVAEGLQSTVLRPFIITQQVIVQAKLRAEESLRLQAQLDSLAAIVASQADLARENENLRELLEIRPGNPQSFIHANLIRSGTPGSESMFLLDVGSRDGVQAGDPVLMRNGRIGLVGVIRKVTGNTAVGLDWSHPEFRVSAKTAERDIYGLVEPRPGEFRWGDRLLLKAIPYHERLDPGTLIVTSGLGGIFPRGIAIGEVLELHQDEGRWVSEYWLRPVVETGSVTHVLVVKADPRGGDLRSLLEEGGRGDESPDGSSPDTSQTSDGYEAGESGV